MALQVWWCSTDSAMALAVAVSAACCSGGSGVSAGDPCIALLWWPFFQGGSYLSAYDCLVRVVRYDWICRCILAACTSEDRRSVWYEAALIRFLLCRALAVALAFRALHRWMFSCASVLWQDTLQQMCRLCTAVLHELFSAGAIQFVLHEQCHRCC